MATNDDHFLLKQDIVIGFEDSIDNINKFAKEFDSLDARIARTVGSLKQMQAEYDSITATTNTKLGNSFKKQIQAKMDEAIATAQVVLSKDKNQKITVSKETIHKIFSDVGACKKKSFMKL